MAELKKIAHIGIVVSDLKKSIEIYKKLLMREPARTEYVDAAKVDLAFFDVAGVEIELLAPTSTDSAVMPFLKETGGGLHHICYEVEDIHEVLQNLKKQHFSLVDEEPRKGAGNSQIAFVDTISTEGVSIEYCEYPGK